MGMKHLFYVLILIIGISNYLFSQSYNINNVDGTTITSCNTTLYDSGGVSGSYGNSECYSVTICSGNSDFLEVSFNEFSLENSFDDLMIFDGPTTSSPSLGSYTGTTTPSNIISTGSCITISFDSDGSVTYDGFEIHITCHCNPAITQVSQICADDNTYYDLNFDIIEMTNASAVDIIVDGITEFSEVGIGIYEFTNLTAGTSIIIEDCDDSNCLQTYNFAVCDLCNSNTAPTDECEDAPLIDLSQPFEGSTDCDYSPTYNSPSACNASIENDSWMSFIAGSEEVEIEYYVGDCSDNDGIQLVVFSGECDNLTIIENSCVNPTGELTDGTWYFFGLEIGAMYYIRIDGYGGDLCPYFFTPISGVVITPENNECPEATVLECGQSEIGNNILATDIDAPDGCTGGGTPSEGVWYSFIGTGQEVTVSTDNPETNFDTEINIYQEPCTSLSCLGGDNDGGTGLTSSYSIMTEIDVEYFIYVDGNNDSFGLFEISLTCHDDPCDAYAGTANIEYQTLCNIKDICALTTDFTNILPYEQIYVLVNDSSDIIDYNNSGMFEDLPYGIYSVYAVNTSEIDVINEIINLGAWSDIPMLSILYCVDIFGPQTFQLLEKITPLFEVPDHYCEGAFIPPMPTTSTNGVPGTWSPLTNNMSTTTYNFTIDSSQCAYNVSDTIFISKLSTTIANQTNQDCAILGTASILAANGIEPYSYFWSSNVENTIEGEAYSLSEGSYDVTVQDLIGCTSEQNLTITNIGHLDISSYVSADPLCFGGEDGSINLTISGGVGDYVISCNEDTFVSSYNNTSINNLSAGNYNISVTDINNCQGTTIETLTEPSKIITSVITSNPSCFGNTDGYIEFQISGGTEPYRLSLSDIIIDLPIVKNLKKGIYEFIVSDSHNCTNKLSAVSLIDTPIDCLKIPDAFTPNGDGINDLWIIENIDMYPSAYIYVFNRWGQKIYQGISDHNPWDGKFNNSFVPAGTYIYTIEPYNGIKTYNGVVTVVY